MKTKGAEKQDQELRRAVQRLPRRERHRLILAYLVRHEPRRVLAAIRRAESRERRAPAA